MTETEQEETPMFRCDICGRSFTSNAGLVIHKGRAHGNQDDPVETRLLKILFPDGKMPVSKRAEIEDWLKQGQRLSS